jgi:hypothetical protein
MMGVGTRRETDRNADNRLRSRRRFMTKAVESSGTPRTVVRRSGSGRPAVSRGFTGVDFDSAASSLAINPPTEPAVLPPRPVERPFVVPEGRFKRVP